MAEGTRMKDLDDRYATLDRALQEETVRGKVAEQNFQEQLHSANSDMMGKIEAINDKYDQMSSTLDRFQMQFRQMFDRLDQIYQKDTSVLGRPPANSFMGEGSSSKSPVISDIYLRRQPEVRATAGVEPQLQVILPGINLFPKLDFPYFDGTMASSCRCSVTPRPILAPPNYFNKPHTTSKITSHHNVVHTTPPKKYLTRAEVIQRRAQGLCFNCDEKFTVGHRCKNRMIYTLMSEAEETKFSSHIEPSTSSEPSHGKRYPPRVSNLIGGRFIDSQSSIDILNSATQQVVAQVPLSTAKEFQAAISAVKRAFISWGNTPVTTRQRIMFKLHELIRKDIDKFAVNITAEQGKTLKDAFNDVSRGLELVEHACGMGSLPIGEFSGDISNRIDIYNIRQPLGVCGGIGFLNFPAMIPLMMFLIAVTCGNTFILKSSERTPGACVHLAELAMEVGLLNGVLNIIHDFNDIIDAICDDKKIKVVSYVGSDALEMFIHVRACANSKQVQIHVGAKCCADVMCDANMYATLSSLVYASLGYAVQRSTEISSVIFVGALKFWAEKLVERTRTLKIDTGIPQGINFFPKLEFPYFDGTLGHCWMLRSQYFFQLVPHMKDLPNITLASMHCEVRVSQWYQHLCRDFRNMIWKIFLDLIASRFDELKTEKIIGDLNKLKHTTSLAAYNDTFEELRAYMLMINRNLTEGYFVASFISGLGEELQFFISLFEPQTLTFIMNIARIYFSKIDALVANFLEVDPCSYGSWKSFKGTRRRLFDDPRGRGSFERGSNVMSLKNEEEVEIRSSNGKSGRTKAHLYLIKTWIKVRGIRADNLGKEMERYRMMGEGNEGREKHMEASSRRGSYDGYLTWHISVGHASLTDSP